MTPYSIVACSAVLFAYALAGQQPPQPLLTEATALSADFSWSSVASQTCLQYHACYDGFECARLTLPLDYRNDTGHNISLAVIRLPAPIPEHHPDHGGTIILNPGGPGGSGIKFALDAAKMLQDGLTSKDGKHFEIVTFDPRGILYSKPNLYCFATPFDVRLWEHEKLAKGPLDESQEALEWQWQFELARGRVCEQSDVGKWDDGTDLRQYVSTAFVARDMLELVKAIEDRKHALTATIADRLQTPMHRDGGKTPKLRYYGQSYGTFLGQLFASMYPHNVGRMILDGNIDGYNWVSAHEYSVDDVESIRSYFFDACFAAGTRCDFFDPTDSVVSDVEERYASILDRLSGKPAFSIHDGHAVMITPEQLEKAFFTASYQPTEGFPALASSLMSVYRHLEYDEPLDRFDAFIEVPLPMLEDLLSDEAAHVLQNEEIAAFVHCADGPDLTDHNMTSFTWHLDDLVDKFPHAAAEQANYKLPCWTMPPSLRTVWRYDGPFGSTETPPLLFLNNHLDLATPAKSARKMASRFDGSKLVVSGNVGHVSLWKGGDCMWDHLRRYMVDGSLPETESWCERTHEPFSAA